MFETAALLRETFRDSDIIARIGANIFTVLAIDTGADHVALIAQRLKQNISRYHSKGSHPYTLPLTLRAVPYDFEKPCSFDELLDRIVTAEGRPTN